MKMVVMAIRDAKVGAFMRPFFVQAVGQGLRSFTDEVNQKRDDNVMFHHPEDFSLWEFGVYDDAVAPHFEVKPVPVVVAKAVDVKVPV